MGWGWTIAVLVGLFALDRFVVWRGARRLRGIYSPANDGGLVPTSPAEHPDVDRQQALKKPHRAALGSAGLASEADSLADEIERQRRSE